MRLAGVVVVSAFAISFVEVDSFRKTMVRDSLSELLAETCKRLERLEEVVPKPPPDWTGQTGIFWADEVPPAVVEKRWFLGYKYIDAFIEFEVLRPVFSYRTQVICSRPAAAPTVLLHVRKMAPSWPALKNERWSEELAETVAQMELIWPGSIKEMDELLDRKRREYYQRFWSGVT